MNQEWYYLGKGLDPFYKPLSPSWLRVPYPETRTNARLKRYLAKDVLQVANDNIFPVGDYEICGSNKRKRPYDVPSKGNAADPQRSLSESQRRARSKVRDIALCNKFDYMFTWTLDADKIDRYDPVVIYKKMRAFLSHATQRKGFTYVCIPEYHKQKDGEEKPAIHFHGLCNLGSVKISPAVSPSGTLLTDKGGRQIFNMTDWTLGFSTCVPLDDDYEKAVNYVCKYITKAEEKIFGKWYLSSRCLQKSPDIVPIDGGISFEDFRDPEKLETGEQYESTAYLDIRIVSEEYERDIHDFGRSGYHYRHYKRPGLGSVPFRNTLDPGDQFEITGYPRGRNLIAS